MEPDFDVDTFVAEVRLAGLYQALLPHAPRLRRAVLKICSLHSSDRWVQRVVRDTFPFGSHTYRWNVHMFTELADPPAPYDEEVKLALYHGPGEHVSYVMGLGEVLLNKKTGGIRPYEGR